MQIKIRNAEIASSLGDITKWKGDIIVNASNSGLYGGGGVDGAIHRAGGPQIAEECAVIRQKQGGCLPGEAAFTTAGQLPLQGIVHTVGPIWKGGNAGEKDILAKCYVSSLELAIMHGAQSVAFPNISTGIYNFPKTLACEIAVATTVRYVQERGDAFMTLKRIEFVCFEPDNAALYEAELGRYPGDPQR
ncbi:macro domain-containing protein [Paenibacillus sp. NFR01]|uniref:macro domain-containing protein n=1 Tax=Paenibacillus sp. NFR01 TaxID=1566279 RepID=UPI0008BE8881|nr:macro domain-containing protein [Paenibacillus sp. NFR01]SET35276.1 O-acetyl-ADP-ribose deacetylase (regulator of RNase III), contains Macro domain [Paenibacillus sp. NFR01]